MIVMLRGRLAVVDDAAIVLDVNGVGYQVYASGAVLKELPPVGEEVLIHTYLQVREDAMVLYGFNSQDEKRLFERIVGVSGVGPKTALGILSTVTPIEFVRAIEQRQTSILTQLPGIGKKTAERLILELRDKLKNDNWDVDEEDIPIATGGALGDAVQALVALGYSESESELMVQAAHSTLGDTNDLQELLKVALASNIRQKGDRAWSRNG